MLEYAWINAKIEKFKIQQILLKNNQLKQFSWVEIFGIMYYRILMLDKLLNVLYIHKINLSFGYVIYYYQIEFITSKHISIKKSRKAILLSFRVILIYFISLVIYYLPNKGCHVLATLIR